MAKKQQQGAQPPKLARGRAKKASFDLARWLNGPVLQGALQLTLGAFIVALFTFVPSMRFPQSFTAFTLFIVMSVLVSQDLHFGSKFLGSCLVVGSGAWGAVTAGALVSIAKSIPWNPYLGHSREDFYHYVALYMCLAAAGLAVLVINRVGADPPYLWAVGMISALAFGIVSNAGLYAPPAVPPAAQTWDNDIIYFWKQVVGRVLLDFMIAQGTAIFTSLVLLPTFASHELRGNVARALQGIGASVSRYSSRLLEPEDPHCLYVPPSKRLKGNLSASTNNLAQQQSSRGGEGGGTNPSAHSANPDRDSDGDLGATNSDSVGVGSLDAPDLLVEAEAVADQALAAMGVLGPKDQEVDVLGGDLTLHDEEVDDETYVKNLRLLSAVPKAGPPPPPPGGKGLGGPPVASFRALLGRARALMPPAMIEPPFVTGFTFHSDSWGRIIAACEALLTRVAGLEVVLEERRQVLGDATLQCMATVNMVPTLRVLFAEVAATCTALAGALHPDAPMPKGSVRPRGGCMSLFGRSWKQTRADVQAIMGDSVRGYLTNIHSQLRATAEGEKHVHIFDSTRMRAIMFTYQLTLGILDAMEELESAVHAMARKTYPASFTATDGGKGASGGKPVAEAQEPAPGPAPGADVEQGVAQPAATTPKPSPSPFAQAASTAAPAPGCAQQPAKPAAAPAAGKPTAAPAAPKAEAHPPPHVLWVLMAVTLELGVPLISGLLHWAKFDLHLLFKPGGVRGALRSRNVQAGVKYYACLLIILMLILGLSSRQDTDQARVYRPGIAFNAAALSMSEKVESTVSKAALWVGGTLAGAILGYVCMVSSNLATNPYGLMVVVCAFTFLVGALATHQYKVLIVLSLMCFGDVVLGQYSSFLGCETCTGTKEFFATRLLAVVMGTLLALLICNLVAPWFNSDWCLEVMGGTFVETHAVMEAAYRRFYAEGQQALCLSQQAAEAARAEVAEANKVLAPEGAMSRAGSLKAPAILQGLAGPPLSVLQAKVAGPLVGVQISLVKDATLWQRGLLATPSIVPRLLQQQYLLLDRLSAAVVMLRPASITGTLTGSAYQKILVPLNDAFMAVIRQLGEVTQAAHQLLHGDHSPQAHQRLQAALQALEASRVHARTQVINHRREYHRSLAKIADAKDIPYMSDPDDLIRALSFVHALIKLIDKATQVAALASTLCVEDRTKQRFSWLC